MGTRSVTHCDGILYQAEDFLLLLYLAKHSFGIISSLKICQVSCKQSVVGPWLVVPFMG